MTFLEEMLQLQKEMKITGREFAMLLDISPAYWNDIKLGRRPIPLYRAIAWAKLFQMKKEDFLEIWFAELVLNASLLWDKK